MANAIHFDSGLVTYTVNDSFSLTFNPADPELLGRLFDAFTALEERQQAKDAAKIPAGDDLFAYFRKQDAAMRELLDSVFCQPVAQYVAPGISMYALSGGLPLWENFLLAVMDEMDAALKAQQKARDPRIQKYLKKYKR